MSNRSSALRQRTRSMAVMTCVAVAVAGGIYASRGLRAQPASAACSGTQCLPGSGYAGDRYWDCGVIAANSVQDCWMGANNVGTTNPGSWLMAGCGWGSAYYDGVGSVALSNYGEQAWGSVKFAGFGTNLSRACYSNPSCNDQDTWTDWVESVQNDSPHNHTIYGHGMY